MCANEGRAVSGPEGKGRRYDFLTTTLLAKGFQLKTAVYTSLLLKTALDVFEEDFEKGEGLLRRVFAVLANWLAPGELEFHLAATIERRDALVDIVFDQHIQQALQEEEEREKEQQAVKRLLDETKLTNTGDYFRGLREVLSVTPAEPAPAEKKQRRPRRRRFYCVDDPEWSFLAEVPR